MPGLFGLISISPDRAFDEEHAENALKLMASRLIYSQDYLLDTFLSPKLGLAIGRLSHPCLENTLWPCVHETDCLDGTVFTHGVLFREGRKIQEGESIKTLTDRNAESRLRELSGSYSLVATTPGGRSVVISVDRTASQPIFYTRQGDQIIFAPEVKAILPLLSARAELNAEAISILLASGHLLSDQTLVSSIKRLRGGYFLEILPSRITVKPYWSYRPGSNARGDTEFALREQLSRLVDESAKKNLGDPDKTIIFLSGGVDSRGILGAALSAVGGAGQRLHTATWGVNSDMPGSDAAVAEKLARQLNLRHTFFQREANEYGKNFEETNFVVDGSADIAAFHPYEFSIIKTIRAMGFERVFRGDQTLGLFDRFVYNHPQAAIAGIRSLEGLSLYSKIVFPQHFRTWSEAGASAIAQLNAEIQGMDPMNARDYLHFAHRIQCYQNPAGYYKQLLLDHRNILLDGSILDFVARVPWQLRMQKKLWRDSSSAAHPDLWSIPLASESGREDWEREMATPSSLRSYIEQQLNDASSGIWEYFNRPALRKLFESFQPENHHLHPTNLATWLRDVAKKNFALALPRLASEIHCKRVRSMISPYYGLLRFLVLKHWHDIFITGHRPPPQLRIP
jgi:hypothetical protein